MQESFEFNDGWKVVLSVTYADLITNRTFSWNHTDRNSIHVVANLVGIISSKIFQYSLSDPDLTGLVKIPTPQQSIEIAVSLLKK